MKIRNAVGLAALALLVGCDEDTPPTAAPDPVQATGNAIAFGIWGPTGTDTCPASVHDQYSTVGPDGLRYLDPEHLEAMGAFAPDTGPVNVSPNRLENQVLVQYYARAWEHL